MRITDKRIAGAVLVALLATAPAAWAGPGSTEKSFNDDNAAIVVAGIVNKAWRERYVARAETGSTGANVAPSAKATSAFDRRIARPVKPAGPAAAVAAPPFSSGIFAGGCGARRVERPRPWCEANAEY